MSVDLIELTWIAINLVAFILTCVAIVDSRADEAAVRLLNGKARELAARGTVRREAIRAFVQFVFLLLAVPSLLTVSTEPRSAVAYLFIGGLMACAIALLYGTVSDRRDRMKMTVMVTADVLNKSDTMLERIEHKLDENTAISQEASDHADAAYKEANSVNEKIATQGAALVKQGEAMDADRAGSRAAVATIDATAEEVHDLHEGTAPAK